MTEIIENGKCEIMIPNELVSKLREITEAKKYLEDGEKELKAQLLAYMQEHDIKSASTDEVTITRLLPSKRINVDVKKLEAEHSDLVAQYYYETITKESVRVTFKGEKK